VGCIYGSWISTSPTSTISPFHDQLECVHSTDILRCWRCFHAMIHAFMHPRNHRPSRNKRYVLYVCSNNLLCNRYCWNLC
jgi:hypothetical protein